MSQTIRDFLDHFIGLRVVDITSHDLGVDEPGDGHVDLMFDDGSYLRIPFPPDTELCYGTTNQCLDHLGCIAAESDPPSPAVLIRM